MTSDLTQPLREALLVVPLGRTIDIVATGRSSSGIAPHTWACQPSSSESRSPDTDHMRDVHSAQLSRPPRSRRRVDR